MYLAQIMSDQGKSLGVEITAKGQAFGQKLYRIQRNFSTKRLWGSWGPRESICLPILTPQYLGGEMLSGRGAPGLEVLPSAPGLGRIAP